MLHPGLFLCLITTLSQSNQSPGAAPLLSNAGQGEAAGRVGGEYDKYSLGPLLGQ